MSTDEDGPSVGSAGAVDDEQPAGRGVASIVGEPVDLWVPIRTGWARAGHAMPRPGSLAWRALPADDPVRAASVAVEEIGAGDNLRRHGPSVARALTEA